MYFADLPSTVLGPSDVHSSLWDFVQSATDFFSWRQDEPPYLDPSPPSVLYGVCLVGSAVCPTGNRLNETLNRNSDGELIV